MAARTYYAFVQVRVGTMEVCSVNHKGDIAHIATDGLAARAALWSVSGSLDNPLDAQRAELARCGATGKQLVERLDSMRADGWAFEAVKNRSLIAHSAAAKTITYLHDPLEQFAHAVGVRIDNPVRNGAALLAHELTHQDGVPRWYMLPGEPGGKVMGQRFVLTEARAYLSQAHIAQTLGVQKEHVSNVVNALHNRDLGAHVMRTHYYSSFDDLVPDEAVSLVNEQFAKWYQKPIITPEGKLLAFDVNHGLGEKIRNLPEDAFYSQPLPDVELAQYREDYRSGFLKGKSTNLENSIFHGKFAMVGAHIGAAATALTVTDILGAYRQSREAGDKRSKELAIDWLGYEAGSAWANSLTNGLPLRARIPLVLMSGIAGSCGARAICDPAVQL